MFKLINNNELQYFISDIFPSEVNHAFTTRNKGFCDGPLATLSTGTAQYKNYIDQVVKNRQLICSTLSINYDTLLMTDQRHTDNIQVIDKNSKTDSNGFIPNTDAVITNTIGLGCMLFFADCTPVMLYDTEYKALGLIHAGWKGTAKNITGKTVKKMQETFGSQPANILAAIGPNIGKCCYEVDLTVAEELKKTLSNCSDFATIITYKAEKAYVDLKLVNRQQLIQCGVQTVDVSKECTCCNSEMFFSHRLTAGKTGRQSLIAQINQGA